MYVCVHVIYVFSTTPHATDFTHGRCIAEDPRKCSVQCERFGVTGSQEKLLAIDPLSKRARKRAPRWLPDRRGPEEGGSAALTVFFVSRQKKFFG